MKTIAFASQKGGSGKSTLAAHLSVFADADASPVLLIDVDPQASLTFWHSMRVAETPVLVKASARELPALLSDARTGGIKWVFIDGPPNDSGAVADMMRAADLTIIPARPSAFDLAAIGPTITMAKTLKRPHLVVLNAAPPRRGMGPNSVVTDARTVIDRMGGAMWPLAITQRAVFAHAIAGGMAAGELEPGGQGDQELRSLWNGVRQIVEKLP